MSRLYDRVMAHGCRPLKISYLYTGQKWSYEDRVRDAGIGRIRETNPAMPDDEIARLATEQMARWSEPEAIEMFGPQDIEDAEVVIGDEVAHYHELTKREGQNVDDRLGVLMPPFSCLWVEAQGAPNLVNAHAWAAVLRVEESTDDEATLDAGKEAFLEATYVVRVILLVEWVKGRPVGPCSTPFSRSVTTVTGSRARAEKHWSRGAFLNSTSSPMRR